MKSKQPKTSSIAPTPSISIFDKRGQSNFSKMNSGPSVQTNKNKVNLPQFRINQHKGA